MSRFVLVLANDAIRAMSTPAEFATLLWGRECVKCGTKWSGTEYCPKCEPVALQKCTAPEDPRDAEIIKTGEDPEWIARASVSIAAMVAEWYAGPARGDQNISADLIARRLERFVPEIDPPEFAAHAAGLTENKG